MKRKRENALTLVETLVSIAVMGVLLTAAYATIQQSLKLHNAMFQESARIVDRCALAERMASDFRMNRGLHAANPGSWELTRSDGSVVSYVQAANAMVRVEGSGPATTNLFRVARLEVSFRGKTPSWRDSLPDSEPATAVRLKFSDVELILGR